MRKSYETHLWEERRRALQEVQERPQRPLNLSDYFVPLKQIGPPRRSKEDPNVEYQGWCRESARLMIWEVGV